MAEWREGCSGTGSRPSALQKRHAGQRGCRTETTGSNRNITFSFKGIGFLNKDLLVQVLVTSRKSTVCVGKSNPLLKKKEI